MTRLTSNFIANLAASVAAALIAVFIVPLYIRFLGSEAYGLIGFYLALRGFLQILDVGAGPVVNREMARYAAHETAAPPARDALRTFEGLYWLAGVVVGLAIAAAAPQIASSWLSARVLPAEQVTSTVRLIGVLIAVQWPAGFYQNALLGLERQVILNATLTAATILTHVSALLLIVSGSVDVKVFFFCAIGISAIQVIVLMAIFRRAMPDLRGGTFRLKSLHHVAGLAAGVGTITVTGAVLAQVDRVILSALLPLEKFAYYSLATLVAGAIVISVAPIFNTLYPRFSSHVAASRLEELREILHFGAQLVTVTAVPAALMVAFFGRDLVELWTRDATTAAAVAPIAALLAGGAALNALMVLPYALQLANGWTRVAVAFNVTAMIVYVPLLFVVATRYGAQGAAIAWLTLNLLYAIVVAPPTFHRLLSGSLQDWVMRDILLPAGVAAAVIAIGAALCSDVKAPYARLGVIVLTYTAACSAAIVVAGRLRQWVTLRLRSSSATS